MELVLDTIFSILSISLYAIRISWWVLIPLIVVLAIQKRWEGWIGTKTASKLDWALLEIVPPPEVLKTPLAMENVLLGLAGGWTDMNKRDKYWRGSFQDTFSLEIVCNDSTMRFFIRCQRKQIGWVESKFYSQYPEAEIREVEDYADRLPEIVPNESWDMWGAAYTLTQRDKKTKEPLWVYPLRTYIDWQDIDNDRVISPLSQLGEVSLHVTKNEYVIIQIIISPRVGEKHVVGKAKEHIDELLGRSEPKKEGGVVGFLIDFVGNFVRGLNGEEMKWSGEEKQEDPSFFDSPQFRMTEGERNVIKAIEMKESKMKFETNINCMYVYKKGEEHKERISDMNGFLRQFGNESLNGLRPKSGTYPSSNVTLFNKTRNRLRMRKLYFAFRTRWMGYLKDSYILNVEEIASIYHLPGTVVQSSGIPRVQSKMTAPPRDLPQ